MNIWEARVQRCLSNLAEYRALRGFIYSVLNLCELGDADLNKAVAPSHSTLAERSATSSAPATRENNKYGHGQHVDSALHTNVELLLYLHYSVRAPDTLQPQLIITGHKTWQLVQTNTKVEEYKSILKVTQKILLVYDLYDYKTFK